MDKQARKKFIKEYKNYGIIAVASLFAIFFLPMIGSTTNLGWKLPYTFVGWIVWIITKCLVAMLNIIIFHSFMEQAKVNVKDNPYYIEANQILMRYGQLSDLIPRDPDTWVKLQYKHKGTTIAITTIISAIGLTQAILTFSWLDMLSYMFTVAMGFIFGILQMDRAEEYWTGEYWQYAKMVEREVIEGKRKVPYQANDITVSIRRADVLEPIHSTDTDSTDKACDVDSGSSGIRSVDVAVSGDGNTSGIYTYVEENN